jgi:two-component system LytT family response regulator
VVFVTAHAEHGAAAFDLDAVDYLLKPFDDARFAHSLEKVRQVLAPPTAAPRAVPRLPVESNGRVRLLELETIDCIEADDKHVLLHTATGTHALRQGLRSLEERLDPVRFARIHRRFIVRLGAIVELGRAFHGDWIVTLRGGRQVVLSRRYRNRLKGLIEPL